MKRRTLILLGLGAFLAGLLLGAPAATVYGWLQPSTPQPSAVQLVGLQGTLSSGRLSSLQLGGRRVLSDLGWDLRPLALLLGRLSFQVKGGGETLVEGGVSASVFGTLRLRDFVATGPVQPLLAAAGKGYLPVAGQMRLDLQELNLKNGLPDGVSGNLQLQGLAWTLAREPLQLGDYRADLTTEDGVQRVSIAALSGPLELSGEGRYAADHSYELELKLKPKPEASPMLRNLVAGAGTPDLQGYYRIRQSGKLAPPP